uniref:Putative secreted protein n=1 Tax=Ixodes scapularis TaxID=6945 RepID=A0A4D5S130_IXOSC
MRSASAATPAASVPGAMCLATTRTPRTAARTVQTTTAVGDTRSTENSRHQQRRPPVSWSRKTTIWLGDSRHFRKRNGSWRKRSTTLK